MIADETTASNFPHSFLKAGQETGFLLLLILIPLSINLWGQHPIELPKVLLLRTIIWLLVALTLIEYLFNGRSLRRDLQTNPLLGAVCLLALVIVVTTLTAVNPRLSVWGSIERGQEALLAIVSTGDFFGEVYPATRTDQNYGLYTADNIYASSYQLSGSIMQIMQNSGASTLSPGDVVVFSGINTSVNAVDSPIVQVSKTNLANSTAVAGVVFSRFNIDAINPDLETTDDTSPTDWEEVEVTPEGDAGPGEFVLVVVQGPAQVNINSLSSNIQPGDLLSTSGSAGLASKAESMSLNGVQTAVPGTVFGKALEPVDGSKEMIYIYVTLQ